MHIPDGFLDPKISCGLMGMAAAVLSYCFQKVKAAVTGLVPQEAFAAVGNGISNLVGKSRRSLTRFGERKIYLMGMTASLIFAAQMFNFPIDKGTSGHLMGGVLAAVLLGPFAGTLVIASVLFVQMLFFSDGGLLAIGANIVNMAFFGTFISYYIYVLVKKYFKEWIGIAVAAWCSVVLASFACALEIGFSGTTALPQVISSMLRVHVPIGLAEALMTVAFINILRKTVPDYKEDS